MRLDQRNTVMLFSNGIGHFQRVYDVGKERSISIPFDKRHIGDVAASLQVRGDVRYVAPPSFTPSNSNATSLRIEAANALWSLLSNLSGASASIVVGNGNEQVVTLLGVETTNEWQNETAVEKPYVVFQTSDGLIKRQPLDFLNGIKFNDEAVRLEVQKALKNNFERIKPDSTFCEVTLASKSEEETTALVQYTVPVAAWKMRYAIHQEGKKFSLEGAAVIDNNTDEDWNDFVVSVVTGNPISFQTDIAEVIVPQRRLVRIVDGTVLGNVNVEDGYQAMAAGGGARAKSASLRGNVKMSMANAASFGLEAACCDEGVALESCAAPMAAAEAPGVESKEVGDFCVFTSKEPTTILARRSAVVPMFTIPLDDAGVVLHYKQENHARRPYRAVKFKNGSKDTLGRGKTSIYQDGVFSGECVLETTKPGENRTLPHCLENGVKIVRETTDHQQRRQSLKITDGVVIDESVSTTVTPYVVENKKDEDFKVLVEHDLNLGRKAVVSFSGVDVEESERISNGYRIYFNLKPNQKLTFEVTETLVTQNEITLGNRFNWVQMNVIQANLPIADNEGIKSAVAVQKELDSVATKISDVQEERNDHIEQKDRVRMDLGAAKDVTDNETVANWVRDLNESETAIRTIDRETLPGLEQKRRDLQEKMAEALQAISVTWTDKPVAVNQPVEN